jgi:hypothetical protein
MERHSLVLTAKRPVGVKKLIEGGLKGYCDGKTSLPW